MTRLVLARLAQLPLVLLLVYTATFVLAWALPGSPLENEGGRRPPPEIEQAMLEQYRLDSGWSFYWDYLGKASGASWLLGDHDRPFDLGPSLRHETWTVNEILAAGLPVSITVGLGAVLLATFLGLGSGAAAALRPGSGWDLASLGLALVGVSVPTFVTGTVLLAVFAAGLGWLPVGGWGTLGHLVLPTITLSLPFAAWIARLSRGEMLEVMRGPAVRAARARGLSERTVVLRHALPQAALPVVAYLGPASAMAVTGSFAVERIFAVPGVGVHFVDAVLAKDLTLVMGVVLAYATLLVLLNLAADMAQAWLDPRIAKG